MRFNPDKQHRRSIRLRGYDYAQPGMYFVTICAQDRECLLGDIEDGAVVLNEVGRMIDKWLRRIAERYPGVVVDEHVIMPNHLHAMIQLCENGIEKRVSLPNIVRWYKTMTTNEALRMVEKGLCAPLRHRLWQRNYFEHVVRDDEGADRIRQYIRQNPIKWPTDPDNPVAQTYGKFIFE